MAELEVPPGLDLSRKTVEATVESAVNSFVTVMNLLGYKMIQPPRSFVSKLADQTVPLVSLSLYLCSEEAEVRDARGALPSPLKPQPKKTRKGLRLSRRSGLRSGRWRTDWVLPCAPASKGSPALGTARGSHASPRPNFRRVHWNYYWVGKRSEPENRRGIPKWLPPTFVNADAPEDLIPVVKDVVA